ncbi:MAG: Cna B-type domain-containing protein, partial [Ruminococcus sp.]|nr:Cna B-type domain-containing protein [Ruminococcus sp.]
MKKSFRKRLLSGFTAAVMGLSAILPTSPLLPLSSGAAEAQVSIPTLPMGDSSPSLPEGSQIPTYDKEYTNYGLFNTTMPLGLANNFHLFAFDSVNIGAHCNGNFATPKVNIGANWGTSQLSTSGGEITVITGEFTGDVNTHTNILLVPETYEVKITTGNGNDEVEKGNPINNGDNVTINGKKATFNAFPSYVYYVSNDFIDFAKEQQNYISLSDELRDPDIWNIKSPIGKDNMLKGAAQLTGKYNDKKEFQVDISDDEKLGPCVLNINAKEMVGDAGTFGGLLINNIGDQPLVINVDLAGYNGDFNQSFATKFTKNGSDISNSEDNVHKGSSVLWNYYDSSNTTDGTFSGTITIGSALMGSVLAPKASIIAGSNIDGTIIADKIETRAETHRGDFLSPSGLTVQKEWSDGNNQHLTDSVEVQLYNADVIDADIFRFDDSEYAATIGLTEVGEPIKLSAENGWRHNWGELPNKGFYYVKETSIDGYAVSSYSNGTGAKGTGVITLSNTPLNYGVTISKINEISEPVEGALFGLYDGETLVKTWLSGSSDNIYIPSGINISELSSKTEFVSTYTIKEIMPPEGFILDTASQKVTLTENVEVTEVDGQSLITKINASLTIGDGMYASTYTYEINDSYTDGFISGREVVITQGSYGYTNTDTFTIDFENGTVKAGETQISSINASADYTTPSIPSMGGFVMPGRSYYYDASSYMIIAATNPLSFQNKVGPTLQKVDEDGNVLAGAVLKLEEGSLSQGRDGYTFKPTAGATSIQWTSGYNELLPLVSIKNDDLDGGTYGHVYRVSEVKAPEGYEKAEDIYLIKQVDYDAYNGWKPKGINIYFISADKGKVSSFPLKLEGNAYSQQIVDSGEDHGWNRIEILKTDASGRVIRMIDEKIAGADVEFNKVKVQKKDDGSINFTSETIVGAEVDLYADNGTEDGVLIAKNIFGADASSVKVSEIKAGPGGTYIKNGRLLPGTYFLVETKAPENATAFEGKQYFTVTDEYTVIAGASSQASIKNIVYGENINIGNAGRKVVAISYVKTDGNMLELKGSDGNAIANLNFNLPSGTFEEVPAFTLPSDGIIVFGGNSNAKFESLIFHFEKDENIKSDYLDISSLGDQYTVNIGNESDDVVIDTTFSIGKQELVKDENGNVSAGGNELDGAEMTLSAKDSEGNEIELTDAMVEGSGFAKVESTEDNATLTKGQYTIINGTLKWVSDSAKKMNLTNLPNGSYTLTETAAPDGYTIVTAFTFEIADGKVTSTEIKVDGETVA